MIRALTMIGLLWVAVACDDTPSTSISGGPATSTTATPSTPATTAPQQSATLAKELAAVTQEAPTSEALPPELVAAALAVTPAEEARFAAGRFNDATNRLSVKQSIDVWIDFGARLPGVTKYLYDQDKARPLTGARLELLARLLKPERNPTLTGDPVKK